MIYTTIFKYSVIQQKGKPMSQLIKLFIGISIISLLNGCALFRVYQPDQQQGTALTQADINQLKTGMTKTKIIDLFGSPVVNEPLKPSQLIYPYSKREQGQQTHSQVIIIHLNDQEQLIRVETIGELLAE